MNNKVSSLSKKNESLDSELASLKRLSSNLPAFFVTDMIADCGSGAYDGVLQASESTYISARVKYYGIHSGSRTLYWKLIDPNGNVRHVENAPTGYSDSEEYYIRTVNNEFTWTGIGGKNKGHWKKGTYRIELYEKSGRKVMWQYFELK